MFEIRAKPTKGSVCPIGLALIAALAAQGALPCEAQPRVGVLSTDTERALAPKDVFKECDDCHEMIVVPAGARWAHRRVSRYAARTKIRGTW